MLINRMNKRSGLLEKEFQHCYVEWDIENFHLASCPDEFVVYSPIFQVNFPVVTEWRLEFKSFWTDGDRNFMSISLERRESNTGPETVWVDWEVKIMENAFTLQCDGFFREKHKLELDLPRFNKLCQLIEDSEPDSLGIRCQMIVDHNHDARYLRNVIYEEETTFSQLSQDLRRMCNKEIFCDTVIEVGKTQFKAHKSILASRNMLMRSYFGVNKYVDFGHVDQESLERILRYLYTGNLFYVLVSPTLYLLKSLQLFGMDEIECFFNTQNYCFTSKVMSRSYICLWPIYPFSTDGYCFSKSYRVNDTLWKASLYPRGYSGSTSYVEIILQYVSGPKPVDICVEFKVPHFLDMPTLVTRKCGCLEIGEVIGSRHLLPNQLLPSIRRNGILFILITIRISTREQICSIEKENGNVSPATLPIDLFTHGLSFNMNQLYNSGLYSDIFLMIRGYRFAAHKCILAARSKTFADILKKFHDRTVVKLDMELSTLQTLLKYMYTGTILCSGLKGHMQAYEAALIFDVSSLKQYCSQHLKMSLSSDNAVDLLIFANEFRDEDLKSATLDFIWKSRMNRRCSGKSWEYLSESRPYVFAEILEYFESQESKN